MLMNNTTSRSSAAASLLGAAAFTLFATAANANITGFIQSNLSQFGSPAELRMQYVGNKYQLKPGTVMVPIKYEAENHWPQSFLLELDVRVTHMAKGTGALYELRRDLAPKDKVWGNVNLVLNNAHLLPMEKLGQQVCDSHDGRDNKIVNTTIPLNLWVKWNNGHSAGPLSIGQQYTALFGDMPAYFVCEAKPLARPGGMAAEKVDMKVTSIDIGFGGNFQPTKPNLATLCKRTRLTVTMKTNKVGPVSFQLQTKIGDNPMQSRQLIAHAQHQGNGVFLAQYQEVISITKTSYIQAMAEDKVNPISLTTPWKDITLQCESNNGGFASNPSNANPDNRNKQQWRPVIAPATQKSQSRQVIAPAAKVKGQKQIKPVQAPATFNRQSSVP
jgi:hypothetical protein